MRLIKLSEPGWQCEFENKSEVKHCLYDWLCKDCKGELPLICDLDDLLNTPCGCEFMVED